MNEHAFYTAAAGAVQRYLAQELQLSGQACRFVRAASGPRVLTVWLAVNPRYAAKIQAMEEELSMAAMLDRGQTIRVGRGSRGTLAVEIPKPAGLCKSAVPAQALPRHRGIVPRLGLDAEFRPVSAQFSDPLAAHLLLAGTTGSGKTNALKLLAWQLARSNDPGDLKMLLFDVRKHGLGWSAFAGLPHLLHSVITDEDTARRGLSWLVAEIDRRAAQRRFKPHLFACIDEVQALLQHPWAVKQVADLVSVGREVGVHLIASAQDPNADQIGDPAIRRNMIRLVGKVTDAQAALIAAGIKGSGAERLSGPGDMLLVQSGAAQRIAVAYLAHTDLAGLPYTDDVDELDLSQYDDPGHTDDQANIARLDPDPAHVALALASGRGITWLAEQLHIGAGRATRAKQYADLLRAELDRLGHTAYTAIPDTADSDLDIIEQMRGEAV